MLSGGCLSSSIEKKLNTGIVTESTQTSATTVSGTKAVRLIFRASTSGSFEAYSGDGTAPTPGSGHKAVRVFSPDNSLLASTTSGSWPSWLTSAEIGISGASNTSATDTNCARFSNAADAAATCDFDGSATTEAVSCGASAGLYRVSEFDCTNGTMRTGDGGPQDGAYIRVTFSRTALVTTENILAVLEYASSALGQAPANPATCFSGGVFSPSATGCSDHVWQAYLKHNAYEVVQPFVMLVPPSSGYVSASANTGGGGVTTKQFILPLAADQTLSIFQLSRISATAHANLTTNCATSSAQCVGVVFYSLTFYRI